MGSLHVVCVEAYPDHWLVRFNADEDLTPSTGPLVTTLMDGAIAFGGVAQRLNGTVVSYNNDRGFGFIRPDDGGADYFIRWTEIVMDGYRALSVGARVRFEPQGGSRRSGRQAPLSALCVP